MKKATGHKFEHCCGFPFIETAPNTAGGLAVTIWPSTWGDDPQEIGFDYGDIRGQFDEINIVCARCGKSAKTLNPGSDARPHELGCLDE